MEFEVTAIRKRPRLLSELIGQEFVSATLSNALSSERMAHAYLFSGPRGTGKTSTARILARSLNCKEGPTADPCGKCDSCIEITRGASPDVIEIDGASNTSVNDVRAIKDEVLYGPQMSPKKIYIIDEVHMLSHSAFNALLKTIEEPPPYVVFIFATTEIHKVPATIRSRCQQFNFRLLTPEQIKDKLAEALRETGKEFENDAIVWIAREANGSMRDAYTVLDQVVSFSDGKLTLSEIREKMGLVGHEAIFAIMEAAAAGKRTETLEQLDSILASGTAVEQVLLELADFLRNCVLMSSGIEKESLLGMNVSQFPRAPREAWDIPRLLFAAEDAFSLYRDIRYSLNPRYELELFIGRLCSLTDRLDPADILEKIQGLRHELAAGKWDADLSEGQKSSLSAVSVGNTPPPPTINAASNQAVFTPGVRQADENSFAELVDRIKANNRALSVILTRAIRREWTGDRLSITFSSQYDADETNKSVNLIRQTVAEMGISPFSFNVILEKPQAEAEESTRVELIKKVFHGQIVHKKE